MNLCRMQEAVDSTTRPENSAIGLANLERSDGVCNVGGDSATIAKIKVTNSDTCSTC